MPRRAIRGDNPRAFSAMLQEFREDGCNILVTGTDELTDAAAATRVFTGAPDRQRYRVLAFTALQALPANVNRFLPDAVAATDDAVTVVDCHTTDRGTTEAASGNPTVPGAPPPEPAPTPPAPSLAGFQTDLSRSLASIEAAAAPLEPAGLRLSLLYLHSLIESFEADRVKQFCRVIGAQVRGLSGMAYYHLGTTPPNPWITEFRPVFDARVDIARRDGDLCQKWHVHEYDYETDWVPLEAPE